MKKYFLLAGILASQIAVVAPDACAQASFGFGGQQIKAEDMHYSKKFIDINYADDGQAYHNLDV